MLFGSFFLKLQHFVNCRNHPQPLLLVQYGHDVVSYAANYDNLRNFPIIKTDPFTPCPQLDNCGSKHTSLISVAEQELIVTKLEIWGVWSLTTVKYITGHFSAALYLFTSKVAARVYLKIDIVKIFDLKNVVS